MATYTPIDNSEVQPEAPLTSSLMIRLRDNPLAIQQGDPSAPQIVTDALSDFAVTAAKMASDTRLYTGTPDNGSFLINGSLRINWIKFDAVGFRATATQAWQTPFIFTRFFCFAGLNYAGIPNPDNDSGFYIQDWSNTDVTVYNPDDQNAHGYAIALGL